MKLGDSIVFSWSANSIVNVPILFAVFGFLYSIVLFSGGCGKVDFHEVYLYNKDSLSTAVVKNRITSLTQYINSIEPYKIPRDKNDSNKHYNVLYNRAKSMLTSSYKELADISSGNSTLKIFSEYANINKDSLRQAIESLQAGSNDKPIWTISINMRDTCTIISDTLYDRKMDLELRNPKKSIIDFFSINSTFGFWFFLSIAQMCFWFLLIPLVIGSVKQTDEIGLKYDIKSALIFGIIPVIFIGLFTYILYWKLIDTYVIDDIFLMQGYNRKMIFYSIPGYIVAILCFSSYLFLSNNLELLDSQVPPPQNKEEQYKILTKAFNFSFLCSTIVLTVFVFWIATLFNATNNTEIMQFYRLETGAIFLNNDFVYLIGLMHSLLLFIFYVPVKIRFSYLKISQEQRQLETEGMTTGKIIWKNIVEVFSTILVTTSPLIAPLIQKLLEVLSL